MAREKLIGGAADFMPDRKFNKKELRKGIREEREHTNDPQIAKEIAKDHLAEECPKYYSHLEKLDHKKMAKESANNRVLRNILIKLAAPELKKEVVEETPVNENTQYQPSGFNDNYHHYAGKLYATYMGDKFVDLKQKYPRSIQAASYVPILGPAVDAMDSGYEWEQGNKGLAVGNAISSGLSLALPFGIGKALGTGGKLGWKAMAQAAKAKTFKPIAKDIGNVGINTGLAASAGKVAELDGYLYDQANKDKTFRQSQDQAVADLEKARLAHGKRLWDQQATHKDPSTITTAYHGNAPRPDFPAFGAAVTHALPSGPAQPPKAPVATAPPPPKPSTTPSVPTVIGPKPPGPDRQIASAGGMPKAGAFTKRSNEGIGSGILNSGGAKSAPPPSNFKPMSTGGYSQNMPQNNNFNPPDTSWIGHLPSRSQNNNFNPPDTSWIGHLPSRSQNNNFNPIQPAIYRVERNDDGTWTDSHGMNVDPNRHAILKYFNNRNDRAMPPTTGRSGSSFDFDPGIYQRPRAPVNDFGFEGRSLPEIMRPHYVREEDAEAWGKAMGHSPNKYPRYYPKQDRPPAHFYPRRLPADGDDHESAVEDRLYRFPDADQPRRRPSYSPYAPSPGRAGSFNVRDLSDDDINAIMSRWLKMSQNRAMRQNIMA